MIHAAAAVINAYKHPLVHVLPNLSAEVVHNDLCGSVYILFPHSLAALPRYVHALHFCISLAWQVHGSYLAGANRTDFRSFLPSTHACLLPAKQRKDRADPVRFECTVGQCLLQGETCCVCRCRFIGKEPLLTFAAAAAAVLK